MKRKLLVVLAILAVLCWAGTASAVTYSFFNITNNGNPDLSGQLAVDVTAVGSQVQFHFTNNVGIASSIADVYFDDGTLLGIASINSSAGVAFSSPANPGDLPGGNAVNFQTTAGFSADSDPPVEPNGVNTASEYLNIIFNLKDSKTFADTIAALGDGSLRIGLHVQAIGTSGGSDSYVNVPIPPSALLLGSGLLGLVGLGWRRRKG